MSVARRQLGNQQQKNTEYWQELLSNVNHSPRTQVVGNRRLRLGITVKYPSIYPQRRAWDAEDSASRITETGLPWDDVGLMCVWCIQHRLAILTCWFVPRRPGVSRGRPTRTQQLHSAVRVNLRSCPWNNLLDPIKARLTWVRRLQRAETLLDPASENTNCYVNRSWILSDISRKWRLKGFYGNRV